MRIRCENLNKSFGDFRVVQDLSFEIGSGRLVALLGASGSGKSTILRILAGLEAADSGTIHFDELDATNLHARAREIGFVFQHYALFRHLTVEENVAFGLTIRKAPRAEARARAMELIELVGLSGFERRYPSQLSGGQRQRVALARALAPSPKLLLLDEPFAAVDAKVREELRQWLRKLHDEVGVTSIFVTHDQDEALAVSDEILVIHEGRLEQKGSPHQILDEPASAYVAGFVGEVNTFDGSLEGGVARAGSLSARIGDQQDSAEIQLIVRTYDMKFWNEEPGVATVRRIIPLGDRVRVHAEVDGLGPIVGQFPRRSSLLEGMAAGSRIQIEITKARAYPRPAQPPTI